MIQTGIKLKTVVDFLKEYLSIIIVVPAFIGGLWQAIELMSISVPYIRFFSISQIVPDGILILLFMFCALLPFFFSMVMRYFFEPQKEINKRKKLKYGVHILLTFLVLSITYYLLNLRETNTVKSVLAETTIITCIIYGVYDFQNREYNSSDFFGKAMYKLLNIPIFILYIVVGYYFCNQIHKTFTITNNLENIKNIKEGIAHKFPNTKQEIIYFNDKYIFIKIIEKLEKDKTGKILKHTKEKVYITKIESLFNDK